jgi:hypothetical protein
MKPYGWLVDELCALLDKVNVCLWQLGKMCSNVFTHLSLFYGRNAGEQHLWEGGNVHAQFHMNWQAPEAKRWQVKVVN